jgi:predicted nucleic acid-binding protein
LIVIDASVAVKWIVLEAHHETALGVFDGEWERIAPDLILPEVANVLRKKLKHREITQDQLAIGLHGLTVAIPRLIPSSELVNDAAALSLELDHSVYDCFYLACALGRGILLSADERFVRKCAAKGYGEAVIVLNERSLEIYEARRAISFLAPSTFEAVERLSKQVERTITSLKAAAAPFGATRFEFVDATAVGPALNSPAYLGLASVLEKLDSEQLSIILAMGWLGRSHQSASEWVTLHENARQVTARGFSEHRAYFMAQMAKVPVGLTKLERYLQDVAPAGRNGA